MISEEYTISASASYSRSPIHNRLCKNRHGNIGSCSRLSAETCLSHQKKATQRTPDTVRVVIDPAEDQAHSDPPSRSPAVSKRDAARSSDAPRRSSRFKERKIAFPSSFLRSSILERFVW